MRTARLLPVSPSMHFPGGGCTCLDPGGGVPAQVLPLWTEFLTHASENITLPQTSFAGGENTTFKILLRKETKGLRIRSHYEVLIVLFIVILLLSVTIKFQQDSVPVSHPCGANVYTLRKKNDVPFR